MSRWFRHYSGMMRDEKLVRVAIKSKQSIERVLWVWGAILESASEVNDNGRFDLDAEEAAYFLRADSSDILDIFDALTNAGHLDDSCVVKWVARQYVSDRSAERQAAYRERKRGKIVHAEHVVNATVTPMSRHRDVTVTPPDTETDTDTLPNGSAVARGAGESDDLSQALYQAAGITDETRTPGLLVLSEPLRWLNAEPPCDLKADILPTLRAKTANGKRPRSWAWFTDAVFEARDRRLAPSPVVRSHSPPAANGRRESVVDVARRIGFGFDGSENGTGNHGDAQRLPAIIGRR